MQVFSLIPDPSCTMLLHSSISLIIFAPISIIMITIVEAHTSIAIQLKSSQSLSYVCVLDRSLRFAKMMFLILIRQALISFTLAYLTHL